MWRLAAISSMNMAIYRNGVSKAAWRKPMYESGVKYLGAKK
jgi:hypothetical protein